MNDLTTAPRFGVRGDKLNKIADAMDAASRMTAEEMRTTRSASLCAFAGTTAALLAAVNREAAAALYDGIAAALRNAPHGGELDRRRIDRAAAALFEAEAKAA